VRCGLATQLLDGRGVGPGVRGALPDVDPTLGTLFAEVVGPERRTVVADGFWPLRGHNIKRLTRFTRRGQRLDYLAIESWLIRVTRLGSPCEPP